MLEPTSVRIALLLRVTLFDGSIWPWLVSIVTVAAVIVRPPAGMTTAPNVPPKLSEPCDTVVPPVYVLVPLRLNVPAPDLTKASEAEPVPVT